MCVCVCVCTANVREGGRVGRNGATYMNYICDSHGKEEMGVAYYAGNQCRSVQIIMKSKMIMVGYCCARYNGDK